MLTRLNRLLGRQDGERREARERPREDGLQSPSHTSRKKRFWKSHRSAGRTSTSTSVTEQEQKMNKVDELALQLQMMTNERNELRAILANYTKDDLNNRLNSELEELKMDHQKEMSEMEKFHKEIRESSYKSKKLTEKINTYHRLLGEWTQMKEKVGMLNEDKRKLKEEQIFLQESCEETRRLCEEAHEKIYNLWTKQRQRSEAAFIPSFFTLRLEKHLHSLLKPKELVTQQKDSAVKLQHHFTESQTRSEHLEHELEETTAQEESLLPMELPQQEHYVPGK
ncbi:hypothetical protein ACRRTK_022673 [Alexandromys fortis]